MLFGVGFCGFSFALRGELDSIGFKDFLRHGSYPVELYTSFHFTILQQGGSYRDRLCVVVFQTKKLFIIGHRYGLCITTL